MWRHSNLKKARKCRFDNGRFQTCRFEVLERLLWPSVPIHFVEVGRSHFSTLMTTTQHLPHKTYTLADVSRGRIPNLSAD